MTGTASANICNWLQVAKLDDQSLYRLTFAEHHLGNIWIRSLHGGVSASMIEVCAEMETRSASDEELDVHISSSSVDYLRITKDADLYAKATIQRKSRRLSIVDVVCWQDSADMPVVRGTVTLKIGPAKTI